jgi:hypothetical protein
MRCVRAWSYSRSFARPLLVLLKDGYRHRRRAVLTHVAVITRRPSPRARAAQNALERAYTNQ